MDPWEHELLNPAVEDELLQNDQLLDSFLRDFAADESSDQHGAPEAPTRRAAHTRAQSAAHTMQPLYEPSHFDWEPQRGRGPPLGITQGPPSHTSHVGPGLPAPGGHPAGNPAGNPIAHPGQPHEPQHEQPLGAHGLPALKIPDSLKAPKKTKKPKDPVTPSLSSGRRRISKEQTRILEDSFQKNTHLSKEERERVCKETGLMVKNVNIWFQNRRQKAKTQMAQTQEKPDIVGFFANRDGATGTPNAGGANSGPANPATTPRTTKTAVRTPQATPYRAKRNSGSFLQGSPRAERDPVGMQKPLMSPAIPHEGYFALSQPYDLPGSPNGQLYSPASTLGEFSPAVPFPQYVQTPTQPQQPILWETPTDQQYLFSGRASPVKGRRGLMQSPNLISKGSASSPSLYSGVGGGAPSSAGSTGSVGSVTPGAAGGHSASSAAIGSARAAELIRSKSAAAISVPPQDYPELKRRRSNFGKYPTFSTPRGDASTTANSTAANSAQVSPNSSPPAPPPDIAPNTPFDAIGAAQAQQRMMATTRTRSYTQPSIRYDSGVRLHLDDSNHQAVLVVENSHRPSFDNRSVSSAALSTASLSSGSTSGPTAASISSVSIPPPMPSQPQSVSPNQYMLENSPPVKYEPAYWGTYDEEALVDESQFFHFPSSDT